MFGNRASAALAVALLVVMATACGGNKPESVELVWRPEQGVDIEWDTAAAKDAPVFKTLVFVSNDTDSTLRDASLRFQFDSTRNAPVGFRVGTVAPLSSRFEGHDQLWSVGDLAPGAHLSVPLGLWFDLDNNVTQSHPVELKLALVSRDLDSAIESNVLKVRLSPQ